MALTALEASTVARALAVSRRLLEEIKPILDGLNVIYDAPGTGAGSTITQGNLDAAPNLSGLTKAQLDSGMNALTFVLRPDIQNAYAAMAQLAARA